MSEFYGRKVTLTWGGNAIPGVREKGLTIGGEAVNITADDHDGVQRLLDEDAEVSHEIPVSGLIRDAVLRQDKANGTIQKTLVMTYEGGYVITGLFNLGPYSEGMSYADASTFEASFKSAGVVTHTPPSP